MSKLRLIRVKYQGWRTYCDNETLLDLCFSADDIKRVCGLDDPPFGTIIDLDVTAKVREPEVTYALGQRFKSDTSEYVLAFSGLNGNSVVLININTGYICSTCVTVHNLNQVTQTEFDRLRGCIKLTPVDPT